MSATFVAEEPPPPSSSLKRKRGAPPSFPSPLFHLPSCLHVSMKQSVSHPRRSPSRSWRRRCTSSRVPRPVVHVTMMMMIDHRSSLQKRSEGLATAISSDNKGFRMLKMMGYKRVIPSSRDADRAFAHHLHRVHRRAQHQGGHVVGEGLGGGVKGAHLHRSATRPIRPGIVGEHTTQHGETSSTEEGAMMRFPVRVIILSSASLSSNMMMIGNRSTISISRAHSRTE